MHNKNNPCIGLCGWIGSGKSTVGKILSEMGCLVIDADREVHRLYNEDRALRESIALHFGRHLLTDRGIDRAALAMQVFAQEEKLRLLESIVHPVLSRHLSDLLEHAPCHAPVFLEAAILGALPEWVKRCDEIWEVVASEELRLQRVVLRGLSEKEARMRMERQKNLAQVAHKAYRRILNEGSPEELRMCVQKELERLRA